MTEEPASQSTSGRDVFVSYASQDAAVAQKVCLALEVVMDGVIWRSTPGTE
jgi:hypothetical protein